MIITKFGGSSLADVEKIQRVATIIKNTISLKPLVVVSALGNTTDDLLDAAESAVNGEFDVSSIENYHYAIIDDLVLSREIVENMF